MSAEDFDRDYYERGIQTGKSCYVDYHWLPELTLRMAHFLVMDLGLSEQTTVLDYGCAKGFLVKAFRILDIPAYGCDISEYAIKSADPGVSEFCSLLAGDSNGLPFAGIHFDWVMSKDVLEHMTEPQIRRFLRAAGRRTDAMFHVIPFGFGGKFLVPEYELDVTHVMRKEPSWWLSLFESYGWEVDVKLEQRGVKERWTSAHPGGNGFFWLRRPK